MAILRDNVNRVTGLVKLPLGAGVHPGDVIHLENPIETEIVPSVKDAMLVTQPDGNAYGDAVFDAQDAEYVFDPPKIEQVQFGEHMYGVTRIGNLWWITQNLYEPTDNFGNGAYTTSCWGCHFDESGNTVWNTGNYNNAGMLYDWTVLTSSWMNDYILHDGWRVPSDADVIDLMAACGIPESNVYEFNADKAYLLMDSQYGEGYDVFGFHGIEAGIIPANHIVPHDNWYPAHCGFFTTTRSGYYNHDMQIQDTNRGAQMRLFTTQNVMQRLPIRLCHDA